MGFESIFFHEFLLYPRSVCSVRLFLSHCLCKRGSYRWICRANSLLFLSGYLLCLFLFQHNTVVVLFLIRSKICVDWVMDQFQQNNNFNCKPWRNIIRNYFEKWSPESLRSCCLHWYLHSDNNLFSRSFLFQRKAAWLSLILRR